MHNILGYYLCGSRHLRVRLISVKDAKKLAIMVHGSEEELGELVLPRPPSTAGLPYDWKQANEHRLSKWLIEAPLDPMPCDPLTIPVDSYEPENVWLGTASISFPSLSPRKSLESGLWCRGCDYLVKEWWRLDSATLSNLTPPNVDPYRYLNGLRFRARSKAGFLEHIQNCYGIEMLISESDDAGDGII